MPPEVTDRLGAARYARRLHGRFVKGDVEGGGIGREFARERRFFPRLGRGGFAGGENIRCAAHDGPI